MNKTTQTKKQSGFTIIEVMIVLAVAGLIMAIVFLAIPALQRSNRNTQRKNDASRLAGLISEYQSNNNGRLPTAFGTGSGQLDATASKWSILSIDNSTTLSTVPGTVPAPAADVVYVYTTAVCGSTPGDNPTSTGASTRQYVVYWYNEGSPDSQCLSS